MVDVGIPVETLLGKIGADELIQLRKFALEQGVIRAGVGQTGCDAVGFAVQYEAFLLRAPTMPTTTKET